MVNIVAPLAFLGFVALIVLIAAEAKWARPARPRPWRRRLISALIGYVLLIVTGNAVTLVDAWPFSAWPLLALNHPRQVRHTQLLAVDARGVELHIDARAFHPISSLELTSWVDVVHPRLTPPQQAASFTYLLDTIERARITAVARGSFGSIGQPLGPLTAPYFIMRPEFWAGDRLPREPLVGLRLYSVSWDLEERARDPNAVTRRLVYELTREGTRP